ncbi:hypothetical protein [Nocardioides phosphati]|nr:hypothetical protein [Nocardioides phosphati]
MGKKKLRKELKKLRADLRKVERRLERAQEQIAAVQQAQQAQVAAGRLDIGQGPVEVETVCAPKALLPKTECCGSRKRCARCPILMLKEGTLPDGLTVKHRKLVGADGKRVTKKQLTSVA